MDAINHSFSATAAIRSTQPGIGGAVAGANHRDLMPPLEELLGHFIGASSRAPLASRKVLMEVDDVQSSIPNTKSARPESMLDWAGRKFELSSRKSGR